MILRNIVKNLKLLVLNYRHLAGAAAGFFLNIALATGRCTRLRDYSARAILRKECGVYILLTVT